MGNQYRGGWVGRLIGAQMDRQISKGVDEWSNQYEGG